MSLLVHLPIRSSSTSITPSRSLFGLSNPIKTLIIVRPLFVMLFYSRFLVPNPSTTQMRLMLFLTPFTLSAALLVLLKILVLTLMPKVCFKMPVLLIMTFLTVSLDTGTDLPILTMRLILAVQSPTIPVLRD